MPKFSANLSILFQEMPFSERFAAARGGLRRGGVLVSVCAPGS